MDKAEDATHPPLPPRPLLAKKRSAMHILRVALFLVRRRKKKVTTTTTQYSSDGKGSFINNLLGAVRPLHQLEDNRSPVACGEVNLPPPPSPCGSEEWLSIESMSRYASAEDLSAMAAEVEEESGPNDIDIQAEEFIARFYEQMRLQRMLMANEAM